MNRPDKLGDPSMDEILASIRQIIAEEPAGTRSRPDARSVNPLLSGTELRSEISSPANGLPPPSLDRLSGALRAKAPEPAAAAFPRKSSFEDDLADLIDDPLPAPAPAEPKASTEIPSGLEALSTASVDAPRADTLPATPPGEPLPAAIEGRPPTPPGMGAMRTNGFYPPQGFMAGPSRPKPKPRDTVALFQSLSSGVSAATDVQEKTALPSAPVIDSFAGISDIAPPEERSSSSPAPSPDIAAPAVSAFDTLSRSDPLVEAPAPSNYAAPALAAAPVAVETVRADGFPTSTLSWERERDAAGIQHEHWNGHNGRSTPNPSPLDALARGLAASAMELPPKPLQRTADIPSLATLIAQPLLPATRDAHEPHMRTLEDAVADMLKPLLQQWLADNMPRIIERALRVEAASSLRAPRKPYGS